MIIKLGALGDVIRTIPIAKSLKNLFPESEISWVTKKSSVEILKTVKEIDKVFTIPFATKEEFDRLYNFDIEIGATSLAEKIGSKQKYGFYADGDYVISFNIGAEDYLNTLFDDETKKTNKKTYQELMFEAADLPYNKEEFHLEIPKTDLNYADKFMLDNKIKTENLIGLHIGSAPRWPSKAWHEESIKKFITLAKEKGFDIFLFAGPDDAEKQSKITQDLAAENIKVYKNNPHNSLMQFASLANFCHALICSDSMALHLSISLKKPTLGLFFCTSPDEVEGYGILTKLVSPNLYEFFPEKMDQYNEELVKSISPEEVLTALEKSLQDRNK